ncbi:MAG: hypothetical protein AAF561_03260 [Planctomycetota bacterium]
MTEDQQGIQLATLNDTVREWHRYRDVRLTYESSISAESELSHYFPLPLTVLGPSREMLEAHAPDLTAALSSREAAASVPEQSHWRPVHKEVCDAEDLIAGLRDHEARQDVWGNFPIVVVALPPELDVRSALAALDEDVDLLPGVLSDASAVAAIACRCESGLCFGICRTVKQHDADLFRHLSRAWLERSSARGFYEARYELGTKPAEREGAQYRNPITYPTPSAVWQMDEDPSFAMLTMVCRDDDDFLGGRITHLHRRLKFADISHASGVAAGRVARGDDDRLVPKLEVLASGTWSPEIDHEPGRWQVFAKRHGFPLKSVGQIATVSLFSPEQEEQPASVVYLDEQLAVGLNPPDSVNQVRAFSLTCRTAEDAEYLRRILGQPASQDALRCTAGGSLDQLRLSASVIRDLDIPWPDANARSQALAIYRKATDVGRRVAEEAEDLQRWAEQLADSAEGSLGRMPSPFELEDDLRHLQDSAAEICVVAGKPLDTRPSPTPDKPQLWPAPLAILKRRERHERDPRVKLDLLLRRAETTLKLDAFLLLSVLTEIGEGHAAEPLSGVARGGSLRPSMGHWVQIGRSARNLLHKLRENGHLPAELPPTFSDSLIAPEPAKVSKLAEPLVRRRNRGAHGGPSHDRDADRHLHDAKVELEALADALPHLNRIMPVHVDEVSATRSEVKVTLRRLVGDNEAFEPEEQRGPATSGFRNLLQGEVYALDLDELTDRFVSLWPWLTLASLDGGPPIVWMFNDANRSTVRYSSPQSAGELSRTDPADHLQPLLR